MRRVPRPTQYRNVFERHSNITRNIDNLTTNDLDSLYVQRNTSRLYQGSVGVRSLNSKRSKTIDSQLYSPAILHHHRSTRVSIVPPWP